MEVDLDRARSALMLRQGEGAHYDASNAPERDLKWARLGTAYFARCLGQLNNADLDKPSTRRGWSRAQIVAQTGYHARLLAQNLEQLDQGDTVDLTLDPTDDQISLGACLPPRALRHLVQHSTVHLNVTWRDLRAVDWDSTLTGAAQNRLKVRDTPLLRARLLWSNALTLDAGARLIDVPPELLDLIKLTA